jgi:hypothetical protein
LDAFCLWANEEVEEVRRLEKDTELAVRMREKLKNLSEDFADKNVQRQTSSSAKTRRGKRNISKVEKQ